MSRSPRCTVSGLLAAGAIAVFAAAGCGSDSDDKQATAAPAAAQDAPKLTKSEIVIGMANASTGVADGEQSKPNQQVAAAWSEWVNTERGGINGHPVKVVVRDTKNDTATAARVARQLLDEDKVLAEVGGADTVSGSVWIKEFNKAKVAVIGGEHQDPALMKDNRYLFSLVVPVTTGVALFADAAATAGAESLGTVLCSESPTCKGAADLLKPRVEQLGMKWTGYVGVRANDANYTAACLSMQKGGAEFLQLALAGPTAIRVLRECQKQNAGFKAYGTAYGGFDGANLEPVSTGVTIVGSLTSFPWFTDEPAVKTYRDVVLKYAGEDFDYKSNVQTQAWASLEMFRKAMANASDNPTREEVVQALGKVKDEDLDGLLPEPVTFTTGAPQKPLRCQWRATLADGTYTDTKVVCLDDQQ